MKYVLPLNGDVSDLNRPYIDASPAYGIEGSIPPAPSIEHPMREIVAVIVGAGLEPSADDLTQLLQAITLIIEEHIPEMPEMPTIPIASETILGVFRVGDGLEIDPITGKLTVDSNIGISLGKIDLLPYRNTELPLGWYFCNNDRYANTTPQGLALISLSSTFKSDWGISGNSSSINVPNMFYGSRGYFLRSANSSSRRLGTAGIEHDAIRNITGEYAPQDIPHSIGLVSSTPSLPSVLKGAFGAGPFKGTGFGTVHSRSSRSLKFDASLTVPTSSDNRPLNVGMTPAIFLGV